MGKVLPFSGVASGLVSGIGSSLNRYEQERLQSGMRGISTAITAIKAIADRNVEECRWYQALLGGIYCFSGITDSHVPQSHMIADRYVERLGQGCLASFCMKIW
jgi:hypothetical protein